MTLLYKKYKQKTQRLCIKKQSYSSIFQDNSCLDDKVLFMLGLLPFLVFVYVHVYVHEDRCRCRCRWIYGHGIK